VANVGKSTLCNLSKKKEEREIDKEAATAVCIDDFALKRRQRYGTIMVDIDTRKIIDMIPSREPDDVMIWLSGFPNLEVVSRDGSIGYSAAVSKAHPQAIQVSDRFHIIKNLNERATQEFHKLFKSRIVIPITSKTAEREIRIGTGNRADKIRLVKEMRAEGRSLHEIKSLTGILPKTIQKYIEMKQEEIPGVNVDSREQEHMDAVKRLQEKVVSVKKFRAQGMSIRAIARETGLAVRTVYTYLSDTFVPVNGQYGKHREGKLASYRDIVLKLKSEGLKYSEIHKTIRAQGYTGGQTALRAFIARERRIRKEIKDQYGDSPVELIDKKYLISLLYKPIEKVKGITEEQLAAIVKTHPLVGEIYNKVKDFKDILMGNNPVKLHSWMEKVSAMGLEEMNRFIKGIQGDIIAVENGIKYIYSNGIAEGSVNKLKVIKRIMYGRCSFDLLRKKMLKHEDLHHFN
jgi:transposase